jgi:hypothetical protein
MTVVRARDRLRAVFALVGILCSCGAAPPSHKTNENSAGRGDSGLLADLGDNTNVPSLNPRNSERKWCHA